MVNNDVLSRARNLLICFLSELLVFERKNEQMGYLFKKTSDLLICSFLLSDLNDSLTSLINPNPPDGGA